MANIKDFYTEIRNKGVLLQNQFRLNLISEDEQINNRLKNITMWAQGAELPGRTQNTAPVTYMAFPLTVPTNVTMTNTLSLTLNMDQNLEIRDTLLKWQAIASDPNIDGGSNFGGNKRIPDSKGDLYLLKSDLKTINIHYILKGIYPVDIGTISLSNTDASVAQCTVTFQYQYWTYGTEGESTKNLIQRQ
jgi:hypothetical protein